MPSITLESPAKRVLTDSTNKRSNIQVSPRASKKLKTENVSPIPKLRAPSKIVNGRHPGSSQPKSQFEEEVLEKLAQDINESKENNSETDQKWSRPSLDGFNEKTSTLCFQQIETEPGSLHGGQTVVRLFGVTEVRVLLCYSVLLPSPLNTAHTFRRVIQSYYMSPTFWPTSMSPRLYPSRKVTAKVSKPSSKQSLPRLDLSSIRFKWCCEKISMAFKATKRARI